MHRPEMWGLVQFTRRPADDAVAVAPIPGKSARDLALDFYYAQLDFFRTHRRWAGSLVELAWTPSTKSDYLSPIRVMKR